MSKSYMPTVASAATSSPVSHGKAGGTTLPGIMSSINPQTDRGLEHQPASSFHLSGAATSPTHQYGTGNITAVHSPRGLHNL
jgi:hypothetical protein